MFARILTTILLFLFVVSEIFSQKMDTDSLLKIASQTKETPAKVNAMMYYAIQHFKKDTSITLDYSKRGFEIAKKIKDKKGELFYYIVMGDFNRYRINYAQSTLFYNEGLALSIAAKEDSITGLFYHNTASNFQLESKYNEALIDYEKAMSFRKKCNDKAGQAGTLNNMAIIYKLWGQLPQALELYLQAAEINEETGNKNWLGKNYNNLGGVYFDMNEDEKSLEYYYKSRDLKLELKDTAGLISSYNNIGMILKSMMMYDSSLAVLQLSIDLGNQSGNLTISHLATTHINIASVLIEQKKYNESIQHLNEAKIISEYNKDKSTLASIYLKMGQTYRDMRNIPEALKYFKLTMEFADAFKSLEKKMWTSQGFSTTYEMAGDYKNALFYAREYKKYSDSLLNGENIKELTEIGMMHEFNQQKKADSIQAAQAKKLQDLEEAQRKKEEEDKLQRQTTYTYFGGGVAILMLVLAFVLLLGYRNKQKANVLITEQKKEVEEQKRIIEIKHKEITDSINYANRIQTALLHNEQHWKQISPEYFIFFRPKDVVSGDFYWSYSADASKDDVRNGNKSIWVVADCTGHGVPGALMSMLGISYLNEIIIENKITDPAQVLNKLREKIITAFGKTTTNQPYRDGMDISICVWNKKTNLLEYAGANNGIWIIRNVTSLESDESVESLNSKSKTQLSQPLARHTRHREQSLATQLAKLSQLIELKPDKMPVGMHVNDSISFTTKTHRLEKGDLVISFSDGYADQFGGEKGKKFKYSNLQKLILENAHDKPESVASQHLLKNNNEMMQTINRKLETCFENWKGNFEQLDDVCITGIKIV